ncbi:hypothetical protein X941_5091 [Burkholderia pseudomallei MSHR5569]|nr:hypothetical protein X941_5091 [Burkholderia pseudomallei MSHR5569]
MPLRRRARLAGIAIALKGASASRRDARRARVRETRAGTRDEHEGERTVVPMLRSPIDCGAGPGRPSSDRMGRRVRASTRRAGPGLRCMGEAARARRAATVAVARVRTRSASLFLG